MLGRPPAEQHDEPDAVGAGHGERAYRPRRGPATRRPVPAPAVPGGGRHCDDRPTVELRTSEVAAATGGRLVGPDVAVAGAAIDSRLVAGRRAVRRRGGRARRPRLRRRGRWRPAAAPRDLTARGRRGADDRAGAVAGGRGRRHASPRSPTLGAAHARLAAPARPGRRRHRLGRQDQREGPAGRGARRPVAHGGQRRVVQQRARRARSRSLGAAERHRGRGDRDGGPRASATSPPLCAVARPTVGRRHRGGRRPHRDVRLDRRGGRGQGRAGGGAAGRAARPCSTRTTPGWRPWPPGPRPACVTFGARAATCAAEGVTPRRRAAPRVPPRDAVGRAEVRLAVAGPPHGRATPWPRPPPPSACGVPLDDVVAGAGDRHACRAGAWSCTHAPARVPGSSTTPTTPTPPRWRPPCGRWPRLDARRRVAVLGVMAELGPTSERRAHRPSATWPATLGIEVVAVGAPAYGGVVVADVAAAVAALGPLGDGRRGAGQGQPGRRPRAPRRRPLLTRRAPARPAPALRRRGGRSGPGGPRRRPAAARVGRTAPAPARERPDQHDRGHRRRLDDRTGQQVADRHRAAEAHDPQRDHTGRARGRSRFCWSTVDSEVMKAK